MGGSQNLRHLGMIATSGSYRRHWLAWRWWKYPLRPDQCTTQNAETIVAQ